MELWKILWLQQDSAFAEFQFQKLLKDLFFINSLIVGGKWLQ